MFGRTFEGKIRSRTFTELPGIDFEKHGREVRVEVTLPNDPARLYEPPDLSGLTGAGAYGGEQMPVYGPRPADGGD